MRKKRPNKVGWPLIVGCLVLSLIPFACCLFPFVPRGPIHEPPHTVGVRKDMQGNVLQQIVLEQTYWTTGPFPGPHGFFTERKYSHTCFLQESGKLRRELSFLRDEHMSRYPDTCKPVENSGLWVIAGFFEPGNDISVLVFDDTRVVHRRSLKCTPDLYHGGHDFRFENGNRTLLYRTARGFDAYDVTTDTVTLWKPPKN